MSHHELGDRLARKILLSLPIGLEKSPLGRSGDQDRAPGQCRTDCPHAFRRRGSSEPGCFLSRNLGIAQKIKVAEIHENTRRG